MVVHRMEGERNGMKMRMFGMGIWRFVAGLIHDHWEAPSDQVSWDKFWS